MTHGMSTSMPDIEGAQGLLAGAESSSEVSSPRQTTAPAVPAEARRQARCRAASLLAATAVVAALALLGFGSRIAARPWSAKHIRPSELQIKEEKGKCVDPFLLNDFSSPEIMMTNGWIFSGRDFKFQPTDFLAYVPPDSFWGYSPIDHGKVSLTLSGAGYITLDFGNCKADAGSKVSVSLNSRIKSIAGPFTISQDLKIRFSDGDILEITEVTEGVIIINKIDIECFAEEEEVKAEEEHERKEEAAGNEDLQEVEREWKREYKTAELSEIETAREKEELEDEKTLEKEQEKKLDEDIARSEQETKEIEKKLKANKTKSAEKLNKMEEKALEKEQEVERIKEALARQVEEAEKKLKAEQEAQKEAEARVEEIAKKLEQELTPVVEKKEEEEQRPAIAGERLYCFALMLPFGYEPGLLKKQQMRNAGIFGCEKYNVFTNSTRLLDTGEPVPFPIELLRFSLWVPFGGRWYTALNTNVFVKIWRQVVSLGTYASYDWTVKVDPDTVFFPERLRAGIHKNIHTWVDGKHSRGGCGKCKLKKWGHDDCAWHVRYLQERSHSCKEALKLVSRKPPIDCGCECSAEDACAWPPKEDGEVTVDHSVDPRAIYINNCKFGLHGPIEVMNSWAVKIYVEKLDLCRNLPDDKWGEDKWMDRCFLQMGVMRVNWFKLLSETACGETPAPCISQDVAFHPFKTSDQYFACQATARAFGDVQI